MSNTQERIKKRREYLKKKGAAYAAMSLAALGFVIWNAMIWNHPVSHGAIWRTVLANISALVAIFCVSIIKRRHEKVKQLPYVPPVITDTLPPEEVLVRGSEEPKEEQSKILLRGTQSGQASAQQELLRGTAGPAEEKSQVLLRGTDGSAGAGEQELLRGSQRQQG